MKLSDGDAMRIIIAQKGNNKGGKSKLGTEKLHSSYFYLDIITLTK
jgi:hypothetical protein